MKRHFTALLLSLVLLCQVLVPMTVAAETPKQPTITPQMLTGEVDRKARPACNITVPGYLMTQELCGAVGERMALATKSYYYGYPNQYAWMLVYEGTRYSFDDDPVCGYYWDYGINVNWFGDFTPYHAGNYVMVTCTSDLDGNVYAGSVTDTPIRVYDYQIPLQDLSLIPDGQSDNFRIEGTTIYMKPYSEAAFKTAIYPRNTTDLRGADGFTDPYSDGSVGVDIWCGEGTIRSSGYAVSSITIRMGQVEKQYYVEVCESLWGHSPRTETVNSCTENGEIIHMCNNCGLQVHESIPPAGHKLQLSQTITSPTQFNAGWGLYVCSRCGEKVEDKIPSLGESFSKFTDVPATAWYYNAAQYAVYHGLFKGTDATTFSPEDPMTRAMLVTVLWRQEGQPDAGTASFTDVAKGQYYAPAVAWAAENGIVNGTGKNRFDPDGLITREQMAAILYRYAEKKGRDVSARKELSSFPDESQVDDYARTPLQWCVGAGLIQGDKAGSKTYLHPLDGATRAQVAAILMRFLESGK